MSTMSYHISSGSLDSAGYVRSRERGLGGMVMYRVPGSIYLYVLTVSDGGLMLLVWSWNA